MSGPIGVLVPEPAPTAVGAWRLLLQGLDETLEGRKCCIGHTLFAGKTYDLPVGSLIVGRDTFLSPGQGEALVRVWRVARGGRLVVERSSFLTRKASFGAGVRCTLRSRLRGYPPEPFDPARRPQFFRPDPFPHQKVVTVAIPGPDTGAVKPWRKWLQEMDEAGFQGQVCVGPWLELGASYELPVGAIVVLCDPHPDRWKKRVRLWRVRRNGAVKVEMDRTLRYVSAFGTSVRAKMRRLLEQYPASRQAAHLVSAAPLWPNDRAGLCAQCRGPVAAGAGLLVRLGEHGPRLLQHQPGQCPSVTAGEPGDDDPRARDEPGG
ncbi:hypothetical protein [Streptomyces longispororuber]|uniref:hypothetical protein n=1 Tax=Streptomyces longispororuber TaxID=68230 RepID=UPI0036FB904A